VQVGARGLLRALRCRLVRSAASVTVGHRQATPFQIIAFGSPTILHGILMQGTETKAALLRPADPQATTRVTPRPFLKMAAPTMLLQLAVLLLASATTNVNAWR
jgi:hypothetical protein